MANNAFRINPHRRRTRAASFFILFCILFITDSLPHAEDLLTGLIKNLQNKNSHIRAQSARELGNIKDIRSVRALITSLNDRESYVRGQAAASLGKIKDVTAVQPLISSLKNDDYFYVRQESAKALGAIKDADAIDPLINALNDEHPDVREETAKALVEIGNPVVERMNQAIHRDDLRVMADAYYLLICRGASDTEDILIRTLYKFGTKKMAVDFAYCENVRLREAAYQWAESQGLKIKRRNFPDRGPIWKMCAH
jgi:HEAT repeat protein